MKYKKRIWMCCCLPVLSLCFLLISFFFTLSFCNLEGSAQWGIRHLFCFSFYLPQLPEAVQDLQPVPQTPETDQKRDNKAKWGTATCFISMSPLELPLKKSVKHHALNDKLTLCPFFQDVHQSNTAAQSPLFFVLKKTKTLVLIKTSQTEITRWLEITNL